MLPMVSASKNQTKDTLNIHPTNQHWVGGGDRYARPCSCSMSNITLSLISRLATCWYIYLQSHNKLAVSYKVVFIYLLNISNVQECRGCINADCQKKSFCLTIDHVGLDTITSIRQHTIYLHHDLAIGFILPNNMIQISCYLYYLLSNQILKWQPTVMIIVEPGDCCNHGECQAYNCFG